MKSIPFLLFLFCVHSGAYCASIEQQLAQAVDAEQERQVALLEELVNINSGTQNIVGIQKVGQRLEQEFQALHFKTRWAEEPASLRRAGTLIAQHPGTRGKRLLLIGHLDTVFPANSPFQVFRRQGDWASGPGVVDDKGGDVIILYALKALQSVHVLDDARITVVLTGDEEDSGKPTSISRKPLLELARQSNVALDFEESLSQNTATIARRGINNWRLITQGIEAHSASIFKPQIGAGAAFELARILNDLRLKLVENDLSFNVGLILGGTRLDYDADAASGRAFGKENVIPNIAIAQGDLRFLSAEQQAKAMETMKNIVNQHLAKTKAQITFQAGIPAMPPKAANLDLLKQYSAVSQAFGYGPVKALNPGLRGAGDISHVAALVGANLAGLGPLGHGTHSVKETIDLNSLPMQTKRAAGLIYRLSTESTKN